MLVFGHVAAATLASQPWSRHRRRPVDLRWVIFFTLLADLVDKPLGLWVFRETINNGRVWFHSLAVNLVLSLLILLWRREPVYVLALWMHQLCDKMWTRPWVALWPLSGAFGYRDLPIDEWAYHLLNPYNVTTELAGMAVVAAIVHRYGLWRPRRLTAWLRTGELAG